MSMDNRELVRRVRATNLNYWRGQDTASLYEVALALCAALESAEKDALMRAKKICAEQSPIYTDHAIADYERGETANSRWAEAMADGAEECEKAIDAALSAKGSS